MFPRLTIRLWLAAALLLFAAAGNVFAAAVSSQEALADAWSWLNLSPTLMDQPHGKLAGTVLPVLDTTGETGFYVLDLVPKGYVVVAADDTVEPIVAFSTTDVFQAAPKSPLYDVLRRDLAGRISRARAAHAGTQAKWRTLRALSSAPKVLNQAGALEAVGGPSVSTVNDVRVAPLVKSEWDQLTVGSEAVYNYYTPPYGAGNPNNYYSGCVATMLAQIMRFHQWPQTPVENSLFQVTVNDKPEERALRGGDGVGGAYNWADMPLVPAAGLPTIEQQAIGDLLSDAGVASNMDYESGGSGAYLTASVLIDTFHYANAAYSTAALSTLNVALDSNLDAGLPVGIGITGGDEGHAVVVDGYGYNTTTLYHHINMGWSGACNAWYNLPTIIAGGYDFNTVSGALFNIDPTVRGEIVSGRLTDGNGNPVSGIAVGVASGSVVVTATTNGKGIYAVKGLASATTYKITPSAESWAFTPATLSVTTGQSSGNGGVGDRTGLDFSSQQLTGSVTVTINPGAIEAGAEWRIDSGTWQQSGGTVSAVPAGTRTVSYRAAHDWLTPANQQVVIANDATTSVSGTYNPKYSLSAVPDNSSDGQVSLNPAPGEQNSYAPNTSVTVTATPSAGYYFGGWIESGTLVGTNPTYTTVVKGASSLVANFPPDSLTGSNTQAYVTGNTGAVTLNVLANLSAGAGTLGIIGVTQPSNGTVAIDENGNLTFTPGKNFHGSTTFSFTAGNGEGGTITRTVTISNWFAASAGTYAGLSLADNLTNESGGYLKVTVTSSGALTGKLMAAGLTHVLTGHFDANANYQAIIARPGNSELNLSLHLDPASDISGTTSDGVTASQIIANRVTFNSRNKTSQAGKYGALLSGNGAVLGNGYVMVSISPTGAATITGRLADGQVISTGGYLNADGSLPYYAGVYKTGTSAGSIFGTMDFQTNSNPQCSGTYAWFRPASSGSYYALGFAESGGVTGSLLQRTFELREALAGDIAAGLSGGDLSSAIDDPVEAPVNGKLTWTAAGQDGLTLSIASSGQVKGSFLDPATGKKVTVLGLWLPAQQLGGGFFTGSNSAGALTLSGQ